MTSDCADGLDCRPCLVEGCNAPFMCFAQKDLQLFDEKTCVSFHSAGLQAAARDSGLTMSYGFGTALAAGVGATIETGTVYGSDGQYGCYMTRCIGATVDVEIGDFVSVGFYTAYDKFSGTGIAIIEEAGEGLAFSTVQVFGLDGELVGTADCFSIEASLAPITAGVYECTTVVDTFIVASPLPTQTAPPIGTATPTHVPTPPTPPPGDANCDGALTAADPTSIVQIIGTGVRAACLLDDADGNGLVEPVDIVVIISRIFAP